MGDELNEMIKLAETALRMAGFEDFTRADGDDYDNSLELYGVSNGARLSDEQQAAIRKVGFGQVYVNHEDKWETHYNWHKGCPVAGWRVRYGHKQTPEQPYHEVEAVVPSWPKDWFDSGYIKVVTP